MYLHTRKSVHVRGMQHDYGGDFHCLPFYKYGVPILWTHLVP